MCHFTVTFGNPRAFFRTRTISLFSFSLRLVCKLSRPEQVSGPHPIPVIDRSASSVPLGGLNRIPGNAVRSVCAPEASLATIAMPFIGHLQMALNAKALHVGRDCIGAGPAQSMNRPIGEASLGASLVKAGKLYHGACSGRTAD